MSAEPYYAPLWHIDTLPFASEFTVDPQPVQAEDRMWSGQLRIDYRYAYRGLQIIWERATSGQRSTIETAWEKYASSTREFRLPDGETFTVLGVQGGLQIRPLYNPLLKHWRYHITLSLESV